MRACVWEGKIAEALAGGRTLRKNQLFEALDYKNLSPQQHGQIDNDLSSLKERGVLYQPRHGYYRLATADEETGSVKQRLRLRIMQARVALDALDHELDKQ